MNTLEVILAECSWASYIHLSAQTRYRPFMRMDDLIEYLFLPHRLVSTDRLWVRHHDTLHSQSGSLCPS